MCRKVWAKAAVMVAATRAMLSPRTRVTSAIRSSSNPASRNSFIERAASMSSSVNTRSPGLTAGSPCSRRMRTIIPSGSSVRCSISVAL